MNTIQPSIESSTSTLGDWLADAIELVQRVNARLRSDPPRALAPRLRHGRQVLTNRQCLLLAGLTDAGDESAA